MDKDEKKRLGESLIELSHGNKNAVQDIALGMEKILYAIGALYFKNWADVEDSVHNLYLFLLQKADKFRVNGNATAWIIRVYENLVRTRLEKMKRENDNLEEFSTKQAIVSRRDEQHILNHLFLREMFSYLKPIECRILIFHYWGKYTIRETAWLVKKSKTTVEYYLHSMKEKIEKKEKTEIKTVK